MISSLALVLRNDLAGLDRVQASVEVFLLELGASNRALYVVRLVLEELVTNTIKYGYDDPSPREIAVTIEVDADAIVARVEDDGREFDPRRAPEPDLGPVLDR